MELSGSRMRAAIFDAETRRVSIETLPIPRPGPDELLVKVCRCGVCGSDVAKTSDGPYPFRTGRFGHEYAGEVLEVGRDVVGHKPGDRIAAFPVVACGTCGICREGGHPFLCEARKSASQGFGEYAVLPAKAAIPLPQSLSLADGALVEPMACGLHAMNVANVRSGARVLVLGAGSMALSAIYWAHQLGAGRVGVLSRSPHRAEMAMAMGADTVLGFDADERARVHDALGGPADIVCECVGKAGMIDLAVELVRPAGTVVSMGMCMQTEPLLPAKCAYKEARLVFPLGYTVDEFVQTARAMDAGSLQAEPMVSEVISLEDLPARLEAMRAGRGGGLKLHVDLSRSAADA